MPSPVLSSRQVQHPVQHSLLLDVVIRHSSHVFMLSSSEGGSLLVISFHPDPSVAFTTLWRQQSATKVTKLGSVCAALIRRGESPSRRGHSIEAWIHRGP